MLNICTLTDNSYMSKGLVMHKSLAKSDFTLHWLCLDTETFDELSKKQLDSVVLYDLKRLEYLNPELIKAKENQPSNYGTQYSQYCWTLTPWFINHVLNKIQRDTYLMYVDSDIELFCDAQKIITAVGDKSIGIHTHRFTPPYKKMDTGWYNCGIVVFKNDKEGKRVSDKWKDWMLNPGNEYAVEYGKCGDQAYLECFFFLTDNICVFDQDNTIIHGAPWCCNDLSGKEIDFFHYSHFTLTEEGYKDSYNGEWRPTLHPNIKKLYDNYYKTMTCLV